MQPDPTIPAGRRAAPGSDPFNSRPVTHGTSVVLIGASTGGPRALAELLRRLPHGFPAGVVIAQHMPAGFTRTLAQRLDRVSPLSVREGQDGDAVTPGCVLLAPGGVQTRLEAGDGAVMLRVEPGPPGELHRPRVDLLFESGAAILGNAATGVVLTGMGDDGAVGLRILRDAGAYTIAECATTAVVYGMPRAAAPAAVSVLPLEKIADALAERCCTRRASCHK